MPPMRLPPGVHIFGSDGQELNVGPGQGLSQPPQFGDDSLAPHHQLPQQKPPEDAATRTARAAAARAEALKHAMAPQPTHAALRAEALDALFKRLAAASDPDEASGISAAIQNVWMQSDSDTASLLMQRARRRSRKAICRWLWRFMTRSLRSRRIGPKLGASAPARACSAAISPGRRTI